MRGPRPPGAATVSRKAPRDDDGPAAGLSRRSVLRTLVASGTFLGFSLLGAFPAARRAYADGYDIKGLPCPSYAENHNCSPGCGPSAVVFATCTSSGWHRTDTVVNGSSTTAYRLEPNGCYGGWADGWMWSQSGCLGCLSLDFRCHDGRTYNCYAGRCSSYISICRWITRCTTV